MDIPTFKKDRVVPTPFFNSMNIFIKNVIKIYLKSKGVKGLPDLVNIQVDFNFRNLKDNSGIDMVQKQSMVLF